MAYVTDQVKRTVEALKASGLKRKEFSVQAERRYIGRHKETGRTMYEYGYAIIMVWVSIARQIELAETFAANGIGVDLYTLEDGRRNIHLTTRHTGIKHTDFRKASVTIEDDSTAEPDTLRLELLFRNAQALKQLAG